MARSRLTSAIDKLEHQLAVNPASKPCPDCGHVRGVAPTRLALVMDGDPDPGPDVCPTCGAQLCNRLTFDERA
jgi:hypothetical protein